MIQDPNIKKITDISNSKLNDILNDISNFEDNDEYF